MNDPRIYRYLMNLYLSFYASFRFVRNIKTKVTSLQNVKSKLWKNKKVGFEPRLKQEHAAKQEMNQGNNTDSS